MWRTLEKRIRKLNVNQIDHLILTHSHFDHANNSKRIKEKFNARLIVHINEAGSLNAGKNDLIQGTTLFTRIMVNLMAKRFESRFSCEPCQHDISISENIFDLKDFGFNAYIMHTPGHSTGSVSVIIDDEIALVGDTMIGVFPWSVFPPFADDIKQLIKSWGKLLETNCSVFIPSHGTANRRSLVEKDFQKKVEKYK
jgi:glyoxylase-like metal-dependent hydrolase (beta-lactamase superfamily II)